MRIPTLFLITHAAAAAVAALAAAAAFHFGGATWSAAMVVAVVAVGGVSLVLSRRFTDALQTMQSAIAQPGQGATRSSGLADFDETLAELCQHAARWDEVAANHREQARELQAILGMLNRRQSSGPATSSQLRGVLAAIGNRLQSLLAKLEQNAVEIGRCTQEVARNAEVQGNAVVKTSAYVEQLTNSIEAVCRDAETIQCQISENGRSVGEALKLVRELNEGIGRIRSHSEASQRKLRGLDDPTRQIRSIVDTIADLASRTDLLALNASVESIRAGEHGRGFAIVADEVRKLAEQAAQATREVTVLLEALQSQTRESIAVLAQEQNEVDAERCLATAAEGVLESLCQNSETDATRVKKIAASGVQQLQLAQEVVVAVEQISELAKSDRDHVDNARWAIKSLANTTLEFGAAVESLQNCGEARRGDGSQPPSADRQNRETLLNVAQAEQPSVPPTGGTTAEPPSTPAVTA